MGLLPVTRAQFQTYRSSRAPRLEPALSVPVKDDWKRKVPKTALKPMPRRQENVADDPSLGNPLLRMERLGPGWLGVIIDYEGIVVESTSPIHRQAWLTLAEEEGKARPLEHNLAIASLMKAEQAISELLCWGREPSYVRRLVNRKKEIFESLVDDGWTPHELPGIRSLLKTLRKQQVPVAVCSTHESDLAPCLEGLGLDELVEATVSAGDVQYCRPDPEAYAYAAMNIGRPTARCAVLGSCNLTIEAAHQLGMQCVGIAGQGPLYQLSAADLVVKDLEDISFVNLKQLFSQEEAVEPMLEPEAQSEDDSY